MSLAHKQSQGETYPTNSRLSAPAGLPWPPPKGQRVPLGLKFMGKTANNIK